MNLYLRKDSHAYNKGKALVVSKAPLPDYRVDLDERHGSTQKEVQLIPTIYIYEVCVLDLKILTFLQIRMSSDVERRVGSLLNSSDSKRAVPFNKSSGTPAQAGNKSSAGGDIRKSDLDIDSAKEKLSLELKQRQEKMKVPIPIFSSYEIIVRCHVHQ